MIEEFLKQNEGKTLEFKENSDNLPGIIRTVIAFANTSGGAKSTQKISTTQAAAFMEVTNRTAGNRLKKLVTQGVLQRVGTSPKDPDAFYVLIHDQFDPDSIL